MPHQHASRGSALSNLAAAMVSGGMFWLLAAASGRWTSGLRPTPFWLATGAVTGLAVSCPRRWRTAVLVGGSLSAVLTGFVSFDESARTVWGPAVGNIVELLAAAWAFERVVGLDRCFRRTRAALLWLAVAPACALIGGLVATIDVSSPVIAGRTDSLGRWVLGDTLGLLVMVPLATAGRTPWIRAFDHRLRLETALTVLALSAFTAFALAASRPFAFGLVPAVMWLGIRFGFRVSAPAVLGMTLSASWFAEQGVGPFVLFTGVPLVEAQMFNLSIAVAGLLCAAHASRAWDDQQQLRATLASLPDVVMVHDGNGAVRGAWGPQELRALVRRSPANPAAEHPPLALPAGGQTVTVFEAAPGVVVERRRQAVGRDRVLSVFRDISAEHRDARARQQLAQHLEDARTGERARLTAELHDGPLQSVIAAELFLDAARRDPSLATSALEQAEAALRAASAGLRGSLVSLANEPKRSGPVGPVLLALARELLEPLGLQVVIDDDERCSFDEAEMATVLAICREALANVASHAGARQVQLRVSLEAGGAAAPSATVIEVADDGRGIADGSQSVIAGHVGMVLMRERAQQLAGRLVVAERDPEDPARPGTVVRLIIPRAASSAGVSNP